MNANLTRSFVRCSDKAIGISLLLLAVLLAAAPLQAAIMEPPATTHRTRNNGLQGHRGAVGYEFSVTRRMHLDMLGLWDAPGNHVTPGNNPSGTNEISGQSAGDGLEVSSIVSLWEKVDEETGILLGQTIVPAGEGGLLKGEFRYAFFDDGGRRWLEPGKVYVLGAIYDRDENGFLDVGDNSSPPAFASGEGIVPGKARYNSNTSSAAYLDSSVNGIWRYAGPNALAIPEPGTLLLIGLGAALGGWWSQHRRKHERIGAGLGYFSLMPPGRLERLEPQETTPDRVNLQTQTETQRVSPSTEATRGERC